MHAYVHASTHTRAMQVKHLCIAKINANHAHSFSLDLFSSFQLLHAVFILQLVNHASFRVASAIAIRECTVCACASTHVRMCMYSHVRVTRERLASAAREPYIYTPFLSMDAAFVLLAHEGSEIRTNRSLLFIQVGLLQLEFL